MAYETKDFFNSTIRQIYQQTGAILSLETRADKQILINSLKLFESTFVYNWQKILYPLLQGPEGSPYRTYSGMRSKPWAEFDALDTVHGGIHGWTLTAEPWATEDSIPALWDEVNRQPHSITGALYYLSEKIESLSIDESMFKVPEFDDSEILADLDCLEKNLTTVFKDVYGCGYQMDCNGNKKEQFSLKTHLFQIFDQLIDGGPILSIDDSCENNYPTMSVYMPTSNLTYDVKIPVREVAGICNITLEDDLNHLKNFIGLENCELLPIYSNYGPLHFIADGTSLEESIWDLDQAVGNLDLTTTLFEAYGYGWVESSNSRPGLISVVNSTSPNKLGGVKVEHSIYAPNFISSGGGISVPAPSTSHFEDSILTVSDYPYSGYGPSSIPGNPPTMPYIDRWMHMMEVGEHEVGRKATNTLPNPAKYGDYIYPSVHIYRSILNQMPTGGVPRTRSAGGNLVSSLSAFNIDETAIWVANGYSRNGILWTDLPEASQPKDCQGNVIGDDNLYYRKPADGTIYKLNTCGQTIETVSEMFEWGVDLPYGSIVQHSQDQNGANRYTGSDLSYVNGDGNGMTIGWQGEFDTTDDLASLTQDTLTVQEHKTGDLNQASIDIRSVNIGSKEVLSFSHGSHGSSTKLASIATSNIDPLTISTHSDNKDIVFKPNDTDSLHLLDNGNAVFFKNAILKSNTGLYPESASGYNEIGNGTLPFDMITGLEVVGLDYLKLGSVAGDEGRIRYGSGIFQGHNGTGWIDLSSSGGTGGISNVVEDISPQLGGNLDLNSQNIDGVGDIDIDGNITANLIKGTLEGAVHFEAQAGENIQKGEAVYVSGLNGNTPVISKAAANNSSTMPAFGIAGENISLNNTGNVVTFGSQSGLDSSVFGEAGVSFSLGDTLYISASSPGKLTNVSPTGESNLIQNIGKIERVSPSTNMTIKVGGSGRSNATPALNTGNIFIGDANNRSTTTNLSDEVKDIAGSMVSGNVESGIDVTYDNANGKLDFNLSAAGIGAGTYGSIDNFNKIDQITVDAQGRITNISVGVTGDISSVSLTADDTNSVSSNTGAASFDVLGGTGIETTASGSEIIIERSLHVSVVDLVGASDGINLSSIVPANRETDISFIRTSGTDQRVQLNIGNSYKVGDSIFLFNDIEGIDNTTIFIEATQGSSYVSASPQLLSNFSSNYVPSSVTYQGALRKIFDFTNGASSATSSGEVIELAQGKRIRLTCIGLTGSLGTFLVTKA